MHSEASTFSREISRHFDSYFEEHNLATSYIDLILILHSEGEVSQNDLAEWMNLAPSTITRFVNKLVKKEVVKKRKAGRTAIIALSQKGEKLAPEFQTLYEKAVKDLEEKLGEKYVYTTKRLLLHGIKLLRE